MCQIDTYIVPTFIKPNKLFRWFFPTLIKLGSMKNTALLTTFPVSHSIKRDVHSAVRVLEISQSTLA